MKFMTQNESLLEMFWHQDTPADMVDVIESTSIEVFREQLGKSPKLLAYLEANISGAAKADPRRQLLEAADESAFPLRQWVESLCALQSWLDARGLEMPVDDQIGYVCCADESAGAGANMTQLPALVADMLEAYGCERAVKRVSRADGE
jgi:hypothetical protein